MTSVVNVAVGLNENEVTRQVEKIEASLVKIETARLDPTYTPQSLTKQLCATNCYEHPSVAKVGAIAANMTMKGGDKKKRLRSRLFLIMPKN